MVAQERFLAAVVVVAGEAILDLQIKTQEMVQTAK
jgi:hypothetical protein